MDYSAEVYSLSNLIPTTASEEEPLLLFLYPSGLPGGDSHLPLEKVNRCGGGVEGEAQVYASIPGEARSSPAYLRHLSPTLALGLR